MLTIEIPKRRLWDEVNEKFIQFGGATLELEHSLVSLSKWESKWCKPFLSKKDKTGEETLDYIRCMTLTPNIDPEVYELLNNENLDAVTEYIDAPMTATWFTNEKNGKRSQEQITSELIYYWMFSLAIPMECENWHLNRLITLIRIFDAKNSPSKKKSQQETAQSYAELNAARRKEFNTKG